MAEETLRRIPGDTSRVGIGRPGTTLRSAASVRGSRLPRLLDTQQHTLRLALEEGGLAAES